MIVKCKTCPNFFDNSVTELEIYGHDEMVYNLFSERRKKGKKDLCDDCLTSQIIESLDIAKKSSKETSEKPQE